MIEKLTKEQTDRFPEFIKKWTDIGLSTEKANRKEAEEGIGEMYEIAGLKKPKIVWCGSPLSQGLTRMIVKKLESNGTLQKKIVDSVGDSVGASVWGSGYGQQDANWLAFYDFFKEVCKLEAQTNKLSGLWKISKNAGWYLPHQNICWISERHNFLSQNNEGRLHNDKRMAVSYPDGFGIYALNGVRFPEELWKKVTSKEMSFNEILKIVDIDQRTQAMKYCKEGAREFYTRIGGKVIDTVTKLDINTEPVKYELWELPKGDIFTKNVHYVIYNCPSTGKEYTKGVPEFKTVAEALAWGMSDDVSVLSPAQWSLLVPLADES